MDIFVTGATGYIGGTVSARLMGAGHRVHGLARNTERAERLEEHGITPVLGTLDDFDILAAAAQSADAVVNAANADHPFAARALAEALAGSGKKLLHTSGTSIVADNAHGQPGGTVYREDTPLEPLPEKASRVATDRMVVAATEKDVHSVVMCPCLIYGRGLGVRPDSIQVPMFIDMAKVSGVPRHPGPGLNIWSNVHIEDCADAYIAALELAPAGSYFYIESGEASMLDLNHSIGRLLGLGERTEPMTLPEAVRAWGAPMAYGMGSNVRVNAYHARDVLGWSPVQPSLEDDIENGSYADYVG